MCQFLRIGMKARLVPYEREQKINDQTVAVPVSLTLGPVDQENRFGYASDETEDVVAGGTGETARMGAWSETWYKVLQRRH